MKLMTKALEKRLPPLYSTESIKGADKVAVMKVFDPCGRFTAFLVEGEGDAEDFRFFGYVVSPQGPDCDEFGYLSLNELQAVKNRFGLGLERDLHFHPTKLSEVLPAGKLGKL